jgi:UDP-glucose 4-epimerase
MPMIMKIMITGGAGFIGSHLCDMFLKEKHEITILTRDTTNLHNISHILNKVDIKKIDITDYKRLGESMQKNKPDIIIHLAGETSHSKSFENPLYDLEVNTKSTLYMLEKIRSSNFKCRFILGSTFVVIGRPTTLPVTELTPCNPTTIYGANKLASENYCSIYNNVYGIDTVCFRITNSFGPREQFVANKNAVNFLIHKAFLGEEITIFNKGKFFRDLIYVSDVINGIKTIMAKGKSGNLYWISSGKKVWFYQLGKWLTELTGTKVKFVSSPTYTKKVDVGNFVVDNSKLKMLGWKQKTTIKDGIKETLKYFETMSQDKPAF